MTHIVKPGDTLAGIAAMHGVTLAELMRANPGVNPYNLRIGQRINVPMHRS